MRLVSVLLGLTVVFSTSTAAQTIDLGRGELPVTVPDSYDSGTPTPLIVLLHGYGSSGAGQNRYFGLSELAEDYGFIMVAPDGTRETGGNQSRFWNATDACCNFYASTVDDSAYIMEIINTIKGDYNIDSNRVYLFGHSNGGFMSYRIAYEHSETIAAVASLAGANHSERREPPPNPVHILQIHGTADSTIAYNGGDIRENRYPGATRTVQRWASYNGCEAEGVGREMRDLVASLPGHESGVLLYNQGCKEGGSAELWTIAAGAHTPLLSASFTPQVVEWLLAHPKPESYMSD